MTTVNSPMAFILAGFLLLGLGLSGTRASAETPNGFNQAELDQMLAPIALYPDTVLSHVLIAATYPLEVVQAARWSRTNPEYAGEYAVEAVEHMSWDPSVMALVAFPELLARMDADLVWTQRLGDAFLIQEYQVLDTIQYLRDEAYAAGHLRSNEYVRVVREPTYIYIEPAVTRVVYVPYYDPRVVYGTWRHSAYPPIYWDHPHGYGHRSGHRTGFSFYWSGGHHVQTAFFFSAFHWSSRKVVVHDHFRYGHRDRGNHGYAGRGFSSGRDVARYADTKHWKHDPAHRRGVAYRRGIDERHAIKTSNGSDRYRDDRRDLLRQRSRTADFTTQRPLARTVPSDSRNRQVADPTARNRDTIRRSSNTRREATASGRRGDDASPSGSSGRRSDPPDARRAASDRASIRSELAQGRKRTGRSVPQTDSRASRPNRARGVQPRSSIGQTSSRSTLRSASRAIQQSTFRSRTSANERAAQARSRPSSASINSSTRGNQRTISRNSSRGTAKRNRQAGASSRAVRTEAPPRARPDRQTDRAQVLRSRDRRR